jgi:hypothetical protein
MQRYLQATSYLLKFLKLKYGTRGRVMAEALCYKQEGCGLRFTQPLTEMSIRSRRTMFLGSRARPVRRADNLTAICEPIV